MIKINCFAIYFLRANLESKKKVLKDLLEKTPVQAPLVLLARLTIVCLDHRAHVAMVRKMAI